VVDDAVIARTGDRNLTSTRCFDRVPSPQRDLRAAPLFLKKRHLRQRVGIIVSGVNMTKRNLPPSMVRDLCDAANCYRIAAWQFPLTPRLLMRLTIQASKLQLGAARILHRTGIAFPTRRAPSIFRAPVVSASR